MEDKAWEEERKDRERDDALRGMLSVARGESSRNRMVARDVVQNELGWVGNPPENTYHLDPDRRDILLVHAREDAAHALGNTISLLKAVRTLKLLMFAIGALLLVVALRLWQLI